MHPIRARIMQAAVPPEWIERLADWQALWTFREAAKTVPAYQDVLTRHGVRAGQVRRPADFYRHVPIIDKASYLQRYPLELLCKGGRLDRAYTIERSSGYSGTPSYWLRGHAEDRQLSLHTEYMFRDLFEADRKRTLVVVTWSQGTWVTGEKFARTVRNLGSRGVLNTTVVSPGIQIDETLEILEAFLPRFEQVVIAGYPPFLKDVIELGADRGIDWPRHRVHLISGGEGFPERWREYMAERLGIERINDARGPHIVSCYGSADTGISSGGETALSLLVRRLAVVDEDLCASLFGGERHAPSVFQFEPTFLRAEAVGRELVFTCRSMMPLVRYNIHDRGGNLSYRFVVDTLRAHGYDARALLGELGWTWKRLYPLPFFYVFGRTDGTTTIYGVNVYTEDISEALSDRELVDLHTGEFQLATTFDGNAEQHLTLTVRLRPHAEPAPAVIERFRQRVVETLVAKNAEYRHLHEVKGGRVVPSVELTHHPVRANKQAIKQKYHMV